MKKKSGNPDQFRTTFRKSEGFQTLKKKLFEKNFREKNFIFLKTSQE